MPDVNNKYIMKPIPRIFLAVFPKANSQTSKISHPGKFFKSLQINNAN